MDMALSYRVGSNTKPMVCHVVLQLVAEGRLGLDDPVSRYFTDPELPFPFGDAITIRMLGNMTSGLRSYEDHPDFVAGRLQGRLDWNTRQLLEMTFSLPTDAGSPNPAFPPGTDFRYANCNTVILGYVASRITGLPLDRLLQERLFGPLGMTSTYVPRDAGFRAPHARGYTRMLSEDGALADGTDTSPLWADAAGVVVGTHRDMAVWLSALLRGDGLTDALRAQRRVGHEDPSVPARYGFGHLRFGEWFGHNGLVIGYSTYHIANVRTGAVVSIACNIDYVSPELSMEAANLVLAEVLASLFPGTDDGMMALILGR
jgi:D-alanyl-D-alanine carboxypeptidase